MPAKLIIDQTNFPAQVSDANVAPIGIFTMNFTNITVTVRFLNVNGPLHGDFESAAYIYVLSERLADEFSMAKLEFRAEGTSKIKGSVGRSNEPIATIGCGSFVLKNVEKARFFLAEHQKTNFDIADSTNFFMMPRSQIETIGDLRIDSTSTFTIAPDRGINLGPTKFDFALKNVGRWAEFFTRKIGHQFNSIKEALTYKKQDDLAKFKEIIFSKDEAHKIDFSALRVLVNHKSALELLDILQLDSNFGAIKPLINGKVLLFAGVAITTNHDTDIGFLNSDLIGHISEFWGFDVDFSDQA